MSGSMGVHGAHTHVRGKPQVSVLSSALFETGSLVHWCLRQAGWPVSFRGFCLYLRSHCQSSGITGAFSCIQFYMGLGDLKSHFCSLSLLPSQSHDLEDSCL